MKSKNIIVETQRIKELMNVPLLNEIKIPRGLLQSIVRLVAKPVSFIGTSADEIDRLFPKFVANTDEEVLDFLRTADNIEPDQLKVLLKIDDAEIKNLLVTAASEDKFIRDLVKVLIASEKAGDAADITKIKGNLSKFLPDDVIDTVKTGVKNELDAEEAADLARREGKKLTRIQNAQDEVINAQKVIDDLADESKLTILRNKEFRTKLSNALKRIQRLKKEDYDILTRQLQRQIDTLESQAKNMSPSARTYWQFMKNKYQGWNIIEKAIFWTLFMASPIGGWISTQNGTAKEIIGTAACNTRNFLGFFPCEEKNNPVPTTQTATTVSDQFIKDASSYDPRLNGLIEKVGNTYYVKLSSGKLLELKMETGKVFLKDDNGKWIDTKTFK
jgi:hypothetical protein